MAKFHIGQQVKVAQNSTLGFLPGEPMLIKDVEPFYDGNKSTFTYTCEFSYSSGGKGLTKLEERYLEA